MRIVAKIGTSSITTDSGSIDTAAITKLTAEIAALRAGGHEVMVVSSGAVAAGVQALGFEARPTDMLTLQAVSAVGQTRFMRVYNDELADHGLVGAQVLLDPHDFVDRTQYLHARETLQRLIELGCVPIINENDAIANDELRYGDNDRIAALVAHAVKADLLVLLTDLDGLYTTDPRADAGAALVPDVAADDPLMAIDAGLGGSGRGSGGMASKLAAARIASWSGVRTVIAKASRPDVLAEVVGGAAVGTTFAAHDRKLPARKLWIAFAAEVVGTIVVDDGAQHALTTRPTSLLPAGVREVRGVFDEGDTVEVCNAAGEVFARGMVETPATELRAVAGLQTADLPDGMVHEVIHRDDLVVLS
ncbi:MAG: glutamate 5-kinase [Ilumatobacter sp.]|uniref:glutamate 5-kinase n=1 Tax=Ilumatobacter sp. TaxID=1967498 RepID=UPI00262E25E8|nr:glutamate 5-kinase [Ilumatobacter sp.]MDJ0771574.1 glutamate 5-kinase [Ilumatobacter sp.]